MKRSAGPLGLFAAWIVLFILISLVAPPSFRSLGNLETLVRQTAIVGFGAIGLTYVIIAAGIDLSVGSIVALASVVIAILLGWNLPPEVALMGGVAAGALVGLLNGVLVTKLHAGPFIVTLATLLAVRGLAKGLANNGRVSAPKSWLTDLIATLPDDRKWMIFPPGVWLLLALSILAAWVLRSTVFGRHVVAVGSNESAARLCGVNVERIKMGVYVLAGACAGLAGLMQFGRLSVGDPTAADGLELDVIAAVVIGGGSLSGGEGSIAGSLIGALIMTTISAGGYQMGLPNWVQECLTGAIIVTAVAIDRWRRARRAD